MERSYGRPKLSESQHRYPGAGAFGGQLWHRKSKEPFAPSHSAQRQMSIFTQLPGVSNINSLSALLVGNNSGRACVDTPQRVPHRAGVAVSGQGSTRAL